MSRLQSSAGRLPDHAAQFIRDDSTGRTSWCRPVTAEAPGVVVTPSVSHPVPIHLRPRLAASLTLCFLLLVGACASPLWRYDRFSIEGVFTDSTCTIMLDGHPLPPSAAAHDAPVQVMRDFAYDAALSPGQGEKMLRCRGLVFLIVSPAGTLPPTGRYRMVDASLSVEPGTAVMSLFGSGVGTGPWPFAVFGAHLAATEGVLQLDAITDSTARGTFRVIARRQLSGE